MGCKCPLCGNELQVKEQVVCIKGASIIVRYGREIRLTPTEQKIFMLLYNKTTRNVHKEQLYNYLYSDHPNPPEENVIHVLISKLNKKLAPIDLVVISAGRGGELVWHLRID